MYEQPGKLLHENFFGRHKQYGLSGGGGTIHASSHLYWTVQAVIAE
jgi:hypothetical protein